VGDLDATLTRIVVKNSASAHDAWSTLGLLRDLGYWPISRRCVVSTSGPFFVLPRNVNAAKCTACIVLRNFYSMTTLTRESSRWCEVCVSIPSAARWNRPRQSQRLALLSRLYK